MAQAAAPSLVWLAWLEDPCLWLLVYFIFKEAIIPAWKRWRAKRKGREVTENLG